MAKIGNTLEELAERCLLNLVWCDARPAVVNATRVFREEKRRKVTVAFSPQLGEVINSIGIIGRYVVLDDSASAYLIASRRQDMWMVMFFQPLQRLSLIVIAPFIPFGSEHIQR